MIINEQNFQLLVDKLIEQIQSDVVFLSDKPVVVGILHGGKIPADYIANKLNLTIQYITIKTRNGLSGKQGVMNIDNNINISFPNNFLFLNKPFLIIDDIFDSGLTMFIAKQIFPKSKTAVIVNKDVQKIKNFDIDYYAIKIPNIWVNFYWETK